MPGTKGNKNAVKHGLYAKQFTPEDQEELLKMSPEDIRHEIYLLRVAIRNLFNIHQRMTEQAEQTLDAGGTPDAEGLSRVTNSLSLAVRALNTCARTYAFLYGKDNALDAEFTEALKSMPVFLDDEYLKRLGKHEEILVLPEKTGNR